MARTPHPPARTVRWFLLLLASLGVAAGCQSGGLGRSSTTGAAPPGQTAAVGGAAHRGAYKLDESGRWVPAREEDLSADEAAIAEARQLLADDKPRLAWTVLDRWIGENEYTSSPLLARAYLLRADAILADGNEYRALFDYEKVILDFPGSAEYAIAVERELEIGIRYIHGLRRRFPFSFGPRIGGASDIGEELLVRVQERMPGSHLAERAGIELADYYYRNRDLAAASEAYEIFIVNHPRSEHAMRAHQRRIYANIARFKGPSYDASSLTEAQVLIEEYAAIDPAGAQRTGLTGAMTARLEESSAAQQLEKAKWYLQRGDPVSARFMLRRLVRTHPRTVSADVALQMLEARGWMPGEREQ